MSTASAAPAVAVLGGGITGLTAAHRLVQRGCRVRLFEASNRLGGAIATEQVDGWLVEAGPNSLVGGDPAVEALLDELHLTGERMPAATTAKNRYVVRRGRLVPVPLSPPALLTSGLLSLSAKVQVMAELMVRPRVRTADVSFEDFMRAHFGQEIVDYGVNPFVAGIYAGNPRKLSARHAFPKLWDAEQVHGSLLRAQRAAAAGRAARGAAALAGIFSFRRGLQALPDALGARLPAGVISRQARLEALVPGPRWNLVWHDGSSPRTESFDAVIAALPAPALAQLRFGTLGERPLAALDNIEHPPVTTLFLGYRREDVPHPLDGFGVLAPEVERRAVLGILFSSSLFAGRAPDGHVALTVIVGGTRQPELARRPLPEILAAIEPDLRTLLGITAAPVFHRHTFWPRAIPQYNLGYEQHFEAMAAVERAHRGLWIGGQARDGISVPAGIAAGERLAARIGT